ncbi:DNA-directed RNA polymerase subunit omega [Anaerosalibacter massiliensis]|uniref:DNA-directed RNA polymerase subunit omega n=1 Tax=Anaerosalibacter massiliensis TaxID=1347392 RepID=A0A9X2MFD2_9FIRM|nr:DNA-directed RNA polymerase subunit omega [Anaerosalibacter massiliensis]MCR2042566.1 DNA-directed RNA polymerase subunit omega [Anaerosalibacter massiliensis]
MLYPSINEVTKKADSRYTLVMLTAKRARQLVDGSKSYIETDSTKPVSIAIEEIAEDKITYKRPDIKSIK